jgi:tetratricopeptide (TPR) repeat protein
MCAEADVNAAGLRQADRVTVRQEWMEIPTYDLGPPSPFPSFHWEPSRGYYPYAALLDFCNEVHPQSHRTVVLENRYLRAVVLPDLGGRIFSVFDKVGGHDLFMVPASLKFQSVGVRGAWLAGGVELNFWHFGHTVTAVCQVNWAMRTLPDGSAGVWVGADVRPIGSRWAVFIGLRPGRAALDMGIRTMAPLALPGLMYWWTNAGVEVTDQSRFFYFGRYANSVHFDHAWPMTDGLDYSWYRNRIIGADMFLMECGRNYLGFFDYDRRHGLAQVADRHQAPGQKYFTWGTDMRGRFWDRVFSDSEQTYCEIQRGRMPTQKAAERMPALTSESWCETWMPLTGVEGLSATENDLILVVSPADEAEAAADAVALTAVREMADLRLEATAGGQPAGRWQIDRVGPGEPFTVTVERPGDRAIDAAKVFDADGRLLLDWTEYPLTGEDWVRQSREEFDPACAGVEEIYLQAEERRLYTWPKRRDSARRLFETGLAKDPGHSGIHLSLAEMDLRDGLPERALEHIEAALARRAGQERALILQGWVRMALGEPEAAAESFAAAARDEAGRPGGLIGLAAANLRLGRWQAALADADRILADRPAHPWGRLLKVIALRRAGREEPARGLLAEALADDPLWSRLHAEAYLLGVDPELGGGRRIADDTVGPACLYLELGLWEDAAEIASVDESNEPFSPAVRLAVVAFARLLAGDRPAADAAAAEMSAAPADGATPWSAGLLRPLREIAETWPDQPMPHLMLGNLLAGLDRRQEAGDAWRRAAELGMDEAVLHRNLAVLAAAEGRWEELAEHNRRAWRRRPGELNLFVEFDQALARLGRQDQRDALWAELPPEATARSLAFSRRVLQHLDACRYDEALEILLTHTFSRQEGNRQLRIGFHEALVGRAVPMIAAGRLTEAAESLAIGLEYPRNMNIGRSERRPDEAIIRYYLGLLAEMSGDPEAARAHWIEAVTEEHTDGSLEQAYEMLTWLALGRRVRMSHLAHLMESLHRGEKPVSPFYRKSYPVEMLVVTHGLAQLARGRIDEARALWREALERNPSLRWARLHLSMPRELLEGLARRTSGR